MRLFAVSRTWTARIDQYGSAIASVMDWYFRWKLGDSNADRLIWICAIEVVERYLELGTLVQVEALMKA